MNELSLNPNISTSLMANAAVGRANSLAASSTVLSKVATIPSLPRQERETETARPVEMEQVVSKIQEYVQHTERRLDFRVDEHSGQTVIRVFDKETDDLIRQIPGELALKIAERLNDEEPTLMFRAQV